jgi:hydroxyacylglutathione hydrolase
MPQRPAPRVLKAPNPGPFTLDGTRTYLVGEHQVAVIDPGPDDEEHVRALSRALEKASEVSILVTHAHRDHAGGAGALASAVQAKVLGPPSVAARFFPEEGGDETSASHGMGSFRCLKEGDAVATDCGELVVLETPGHSVDHLSFRWPAGGALFVGDLLLGRGDTTWLGEYRGCVGDYLASLRRVRAVRPEVVFPAHGPPIQSPDAAVERFDRHRRGRLLQVEAALQAHPGATVDDLVLLVYGPRLSEGMERPARASIEVMIHHLRGDDPGSERGGPGTGHQPTAGRP